MNLKYVEGESKLTYDVLRRQAEFRPESPQATTGPAPTDASSLQPAELSAMTEQQLEALLALRKGNGKVGKGGKAGKGGNREKAGTKGE